MVKKMFVDSLVVFIILLSCVINAQEKKEYSNPILSGFYPDPTICRVGEDYYLVNSTFTYFPGLGIFKSKDLVNWKLIGYALDRPEQLNLDSAGVSRGLFAPSLRYNKGIFYIVCTNVDKGGNFVITSKNPAGPWSNPVWLPKVNGIDPSIFFDDNGKAYIVFNSNPPDNKPIYQGHRTIRMYGFDYVSMQVTGEEKIIVNGGADISKKPVWIEGPHLFKKDGLYYLICAEGGTESDHSEVVFRSEKVDGPYISYKDNPILTQRTLDPERKLPITSTGHADFVQTPKGDWYAVFLGCRPYTGYYYNIGRETFLAPVTWKDGWPVIVSKDELVKYHYPYPLSADKNFKGIPYSGSFEYKDDFNTAKLDLNWQFLKTPRKKWYDLESKKGFLAMKVLPETCSGKMNPAFLAHRQQHNICTASTGMNFKPGSENEKSGLIIYQNETHYYFICKSLSAGKPVIQLFKSTADRKKINNMELIASHELGNKENDSEIYFKIDFNNGNYSFSYGFTKGKWTLLKDNVDGKFLSTKVAGGFVGSMFALYSTSLGSPSENVSYFDWFDYNGKSETLK